MVEDSEKIRFIDRLSLSSHSSHPAPRAWEDGTDEGLVDVGGGEPLHGGGAVASSAGGAAVATLAEAAPVEGKRPWTSCLKQRRRMVVVAVPPDLGVVLQLSLIHI